MADLYDLPLPGKHDIGDARHDVEFVLTVSPVNTDRLMARAILVLLDEAERRATVDRLLTLAREGQI